MEIKIKNLTKTYQTKQDAKKILHQVNLQVHHGEWVNIIGRSGSGKTTLLKCIAGLIPVDSLSTISLGPLEMQHATEEEKRDFRRKHIGFIFQEYELFPAYTAVQNVMLPELPYKNKEQLSIRAKELLETLMLEHRMKAVPDQLSGGEKQRVAIARALLNNPGLLLCDEPTGNLDRDSRDQILHILKKCQAEGRTIVFVTHDLEILPYGDRVMSMNSGKLEEVDAEIVATNPFP
ncbi:ABC transporter ATP-binding protein [Virgibacillus dokdonensis]|uniref:ABC transporter ATP-binding protein n=1 Tax=Virgibacillus dokdonensis TaxID=302167 RepID=A0A3E0WV77_9BACI|nr:ABC transporter ATP-binding protein [Virgibacillus dokdonensis]RFA35906.1 ABC transporter ATP-binding protein [Virgibacillus dokdonensis]